MKFDAIVIGAGQPGGPLSYRLADRGWNVALVERAQLGGKGAVYIHPTLAEGLWALMETVKLVD